MKKLILIINVIAIAFSANAQKIKEAEVPAPVKTTFSKAYPAIKDPKWEKEDGKYEAEFKEGKVATSVLYTADGALIETEIEIAVSTLPKGVTDYVTKNLAGKKIDEASKITDVKGTVTYEAEVSKADYLFDATGNFIKKKEASKEDKKDKK